MKLLVAVLLTTSFAIACGSLKTQTSDTASANYESASSTILSCATPDKMTRITVERSSSDQLFMTVFFQSRQVFRKMVNLEKYSDRQYYRSSKFKNRRQASSELSLQSYYKGSKLIGEFSEHSYLPELPTDAEYSGLACEISK